MQRNHFFLRDQYQPGGRQLLNHTLQQGAAIQRLGLRYALDYFVDKAYHIPGFRMLTLLLGFYLINMSLIDRSAANILRALIEFMPGGHFITHSLDNLGVISKAAAWVEQKLAALAESRTPFAAAAREGIQQAAPTRYSKFFGYLCNLFIGDISGNNSVQEHWYAGHPDLVGQKQEGHVYPAQIEIRHRGARQRTPYIHPCRLYASIHAGKAFAEQPVASLGTA